MLLSRLIDNEFACSFGTSAFLRYGLMTNTQAEINKSDRRPSYFTSSVAFQ